MELVSRSSQVSIRDCYVSDDDHRIMVPFGLKDTEMINLNVYYLLRVYREVSD